MKCVFYLSFFTPQFPQSTVPVPPCGNIHPKCSCHECSSYTIYNIQSRVHSSYTIYNIQSLVHSSYNIYNIQSRAVLINHEQNNERVWSRHEQWIIVTQVLLLYFSTFLHSDQLRHVHNNTTPLLWDQVSPSSSSQEINDHNHHFTRLVHSKSEIRSEMLLTSSSLMP